MARPKHLKYIVLTYELLTSDLSDKEQKVLGNIIGVVQGGGRYRFDNQWISDYLQTHPNSASRIVSSLQAKGLVEVILVKKEGTNSIDHRVITLTERCINAYVDTPINTSVDTPINTSVDTPINTSVNHNNKEYNTKDNNIFVRFWDLYDYKVRKKDTQKAWDKIDPKYHNKILAHVKHFVKQTFTDPKLYPSRPHPATYLNGERWNDELITSNGQADWKLDTTGFPMAYCSKCNKSESYRFEDLQGESRCCQGRLSARKLVEV